MYVRGIAQSSGLNQFGNEDHLLRPWIRDTARRVYERAGIGPKDVDLLYIQDPTSVWILQMLEWYGFCEVGEAGPFVADGNIGADGLIPVNTNGGQLSEAYMWGWLHLVEAVRQLRGEAGARQRADAATALYCSTQAFRKAAATVLSRHPE